MNGKFIRAKSVLWCSHCRIHRYVAAPFSRRWCGEVSGHPKDIYAIPPFRVKTFPHAFIPRTVLLSVFAVWWLWLVCRRWCCYSAWVRPPCWPTAPACLRAATVANPRHPLRRPQRLSPLWRCHRPPHLSTSHSFRSCWCWFLQGFYFKKTFAIIFKFNTLSRRNYTLIARIKK